MVVCSATLHSFDVKKMAVSRPVIRREEKTGSQTFLVVCITQLNILSLSGLEEYYYTYCPFHSLKSIITLIALFTP